MNFIKLEAALCCLALASTAAALEPKEVGPPAVIHVSARGDDRHDGSEGKPVKTLARAKQLIPRPLAPESIEIRIAGTYFLDEPLVFSEKFTASLLGPPLRVTGGTLSGGRELGPWRVDGNVWKIDIPQAKDGKWQFRDVYINNERRPRTRTPDADFFRVQKTGPDRRTSFTFKSGDLKPIAEPSAAEVVFLHDWSISRIPIKAIDAASSTISFTHPIGNAAPHYAIDHFEPHARYYLEGAPEYLDAPGEWHLDTKTGVLSYFPHPGEVPDKCQAIAPHLECLVDVQKCSGHLTFENMTFAHSHWALPAGGYAGSQASFHEDRSQGGKTPPRRMVPAAVSVNNASGVVFTNCKFEHLGGSGLHLHQHCRQNRVENCLFRDIGANGAMIGEPGVPPGYDKNQDAAEQVSTENTISNCTVEHCGQLDFGAVGIWIGIAARNKVADNEVRQLPYTGVSVGWRWDTTWTPCFANEVTGNHIHHVLQKMSDGGGIYTLGRQEGTKLLNNKIHDIPTNLGRAESNVIFMDEGSSEILVEGNTIYNLARSPIRFHKAEKNTLVKNTLVAPPGVPHFRYNNASEKTMTFVDNQLLEAEKWTPPGE